MKNDKPNLDEDLAFASVMLNKIVEAVGEKSPGVRTIATVANMLGVAIWFSARQELAPLALLAATAISKTAMEAMQKALGSPREAAKAAQQADDMLEEAKKKASPHTPRG